MGNSVAAIWKGSLALVVLLAVPAAAQGAEQPSQGVAHPAVEPDADRALRQMTDHLAGLQTFTVQSFSVDEVVLGNGQKIQVTNDSKVSVQRPNKLRSEQLGSGSSLRFWYDGTTMTLACGASNTYGTAPAPGTLDATIDAARKQYGIEAPGANLLYSHPYDILMEQVRSGRVIGVETVDGVAATHLAFEGDEVDWQVWIQRDSQPLPLRFVITTKTMKEQPQFTVQLSHWEPQAQLPESTFEFQPPSGATRVDSLPTSCGSRGASR